MATGGGIVVSFNSDDVDPSDFLIGLKLIPYIRARVEKWEQESKTLNILVTGKTGTGKSTLINAIIGKEVAREGHNLDPMTGKVTAYKLTQGDITVNVYDSPGLEDGTVDQDEYLKDIKDNCADMDLIVYCIRMSEERVLERGPDVKAMTTLTETFGPEMWNNTVFLLTFANDIVADAEDEHGDENSTEVQKHFGYEYEEWEKLLRKLLQDPVGVPKEIVDGIVVIPAGHKNEPVLPDSSNMAGESYWLSRVWLKALGSTKPRGQLALIKLNLHRIQTREKEFENDGDIGCELLSHHKLIFKEKGAELGRALGIPTGEAIGSVAGLMTGRASFIDSVVMCLAIKAGLVDPNESFDIGTTNEEDMKGC